MDRSEIKFSIQHPIPVSVSEKDRTSLQTMLHAGKARARAFTRAQVLLKAAEGWADVWRGLRYQPQYLHPVYGNGISLADLKRSCPIRSNSASTRSRQAVCSIRRTNAAQERPGKPDRGRKTGRTKEKPTGTRRSRGEKQTAPVDQSLPSRGNLRACDPDGRAHRSDPVSVGLPAPGRPCLKRCAPTQDRRHPHTSTIGRPPHARGGGSAHTAAHTSLWLELSEGSRSGGPAPDAAPMSRRDVLANRFWGSGACQPSGGRSTSRRHQDAIGAHHERWSQYKRVSEQTLPGLF